MSPHNLLLFSKRAVVTMLLAGFDGHGRGGAWGARGSGASTRVLAAAGGCRSRRGDYQQKRQKKALENERVGGAAAASSARTAGCIFTDGITTFFNSHILKIYTYI